LDEIISKALEKDRELRCQTAAELRADLKRLTRTLDSSRDSVATEPAQPVSSGGIPVVSAAGSHPVAPQKSPRALLALLALLVAAGIGLYAGKLVFTPPP